MKDISVVISYSELEDIFLKPLLKQCLNFSNDVVVVSYNKLFNGGGNNLNYASNIINQYQNVRLEVLNLPAYVPHTNYYHNLMRTVGTHFCGYDYVLHLDADEIPDDSFCNWLEEDWHPDGIYWFTSYWYFRDPIYRAKSWEAFGLLANKKDLDWDVWLKTERKQILYKKPIYSQKNKYRFNSFDGGFQLDILKYDKPMIHHFSWVRKKEDLLKKVKNWGHKDDRDWIKLVEEEYSRPFNGTDFVHGYNYDVVDNIFNIKL